MKTFSDEALAALQRGDAIVSASIEIFPVDIVPQPFVEGQTVQVNWYQNTFIQVGGNDEAQMGIGFFDETHTQIGTATYPGLAQPTTWTARSVSDTIPADCWYIRIYQNFHRLVGADVDGYIDAITVTIDGSPVPIINPGAETGDTTGWTVEVGGLGVFTVANDGVPAYQGTHYFYGGPHLGSTAYQEINNGYTRTAGTPIRLWGGYGAKDLPSDEGTSTFLGIGDRGLVNQSSAAVGGSSQNLTLTLSGIEPAALEVLDPLEVTGASAVVRRLIFDSSGTVLLGAYVYTRGRIDELKTSEVVGGAASIELSVEGAARGLGRKGGRLRSDADQRLINPTDGFYRVVSAAPKKTLYWGGKKPATFG